MFQELKTKYKKKNEKLRKREEVKGMSRKCNKSQNHSVIEGCFSQKSDIRFILLISREDERLFCVIRSGPSTFRVWQCPAQWGARARVNEQ